MLRWMRLPKMPDSYLLSCNKSASCNCAVCMVSRMVCDDARETFPEQIGRASQVYLEGRQYQHSRCANIAAEYKWFLFFLATSVAETERRTFKECSSTGNLCVDCRCMQSGGGEPGASCSGHVGGDDTAGGDDGYLDQTLWGGHS